MLKAKVDLEKYLERKILKIVTNTETINKVCEYAEQHYDIPQGFTSDFITMRTSLMEANEFILFCILDSIDKITKEANDLRNNKLKEYFTESEIKTYSNSKFKVDKIKFPLKFKAIQISEDQWNTKIDFKMLIKMRIAQLINYNEDTQRTMERIVRGNTEIYRIKIDKSAIYAIEESYKNGTYIPTPLTFNIPEDSNADFYYDEEKMELVIRSLDRFDIVDGYHRYLAACKACDSDKNINFTMELRIVNFPEYKAQQFIFQEDQKTKMPKIDSNTFDQNSLANQIVKRINENPQSNLRGLISRNNGIINFADLAGLINFYYIANEKEKGNQLLISVTRELINNFNLLTEYDEKFITTRYQFKKLMAIVHCFAYYYNKDKANMCEVIEQVIHKLKELDGIDFSKRVPRRGLANEINRLLEEVLENV